MRKLGLCVISILLFACSSGSTGSGLQTDTVSKDTVNNSALLQQETKRKMDSLGLEVKTPKDKNGKVLKGKELEEYYIKLIDSTPVKAQK